MNPKKHGKGIDSLRRRLAELDDAVTVISFDVFDTLVQRSVPHPDVTKIAAANHLHRLVTAGNDDTDVQQLLKLRLESEVELRNQAVKRGGDPECRIDEVFSSWMESVAVSPDLHLDDLVRTELDAELSVCYPTPGMLAIVSELVQKGKRLIFLSDMYLRTWMIQSILKHCGYELFFQTGYVSCEFEKAKYSGELYRIILNEENVTSECLTHVGDRFQADVAGARKAGVKAIRFIDRCKELQHAEQRQLEKMRLKNGFWSGARWTARTIGHPAEVARSGEDDFYSIGFEFVGPLLTNYSYGLLPAETPSFEPELLDLKSAYPTFSDARVVSHGPLIEKLLTTISGETLGDAAQGTSDIQWHKDIEAVREGTIDFAEAYAKSLAFRDVNSDSDGVFFLFQLDRLVRAPNPREKQLLKWLLVKDHGVRPSLEKRERGGSSKHCGNKTLRHFKFRHYMQLWLSNLFSSSPQAGRAGQISRLPPPHEIAIFWLKSQVAARQRLKDGLKRILGKSKPTK